MCLAILTYKALVVGAQIRFVGFLFSSLAASINHFTGKRDVILKFGGTKLPHLVAVAAVLKTRSPAEVGVSGFTKFFFSSVVLKVVQLTTSYFNARLDSIRIYWSHVTAVEDHSYRNCPS